MPTDPIAESVSRSIADVPEGPVRDRLLSSINLIDNYNRGWVAEVVVAVVLDAEMVGEGYGDWDLNYRGKRIEVKCAGDIQSWPQKRRSPVAFGIAPTQGYIAQPDGSYLADTEKKRRSEAYVFCHHLGVEPDNPEDWTFYVATTALIDQRCGMQKTIGLKSLMEKIEPVVASATELRSAVDGVLGLTRSS